MPCWRKTGSAVWKTLLTFYFLAISCYILMVVQNNRTRILPQSGTVPENSPQNVPQIVPQNLPQIAPQNLPQIVPQNLPQVVPQNLPQKVSQIVPQKLPQIVPQKVPQNDTVPSVTWITMGLCWSGNAQFLGKNKFPYKEAVPLSIQLWSKFTPAKVLL